eukprot:m.116885 g.116885  ORF g.116885 m.116885 type:complete len:485 (-) comp9511_c0_seq14:56-1510(-)
MTDVWLSRLTCRRDDLAVSAATAHEPFDFIRASQAKMWTQLFRRLNTLASDRGIPLSTARKQSKLKGSDLIEALSDAPLSTPIFIYDWQDLLQQMIILRNPVYLANGDAEDGINDAWGLIQVQFRVAELMEVQQTFAELHIENRQLGVDDDYLFPGSVDTFVEACSVAATKALEDGNLGALQQTCRTGCTVSLRPHVWFHILCQDVAPFHKLYHEQLVQEVQRYDFLTDRLFVSEAKAAALDDTYFVFEDVVKEVLILFSRDTEMLAKLPENACVVQRACGFVERASRLLTRSVASAWLPKGRLTLPSGETKSVIFPPNGILPFRGMGRFVAPLAYLYGDTSAVYHIFRALYVKYFHHLHTVSSHPMSILRLSQKFEVWLQAHQPRLFLHFKAIGVQPLSIALPWMTSLFVGFLEIEQILLLFDRIIGFDSLDVLPILAVAIFAFRRTSLLQASSPKDAAAIMKDLRGLRAIPLLQYSLFGDSH